MNVYQVSSKVIYHDVNGSYLHDSILHVFVDRTILAKDVEHAIVIFKKNIADFVDYLHTAEYGGRLGLNVIRIHSLVIHSVEEVAVNVFGVIEVTS